jgi:hypothetical protein
MRLLYSILDKRYKYYSETQLNRNYLVSIWNFYQVYSISLAITGIEDKQIFRKNNLISKFIKNSINGIDYSLYNKILKYIKKDIKVVNLAFEIINQKKENISFFGDKYVPGMIAISINDDD